MARSGPASHRLSIEDAILAIANAVRPLEAEITARGDRIVAHVRLAPRADDGGRVAREIAHRDATDAGALRARLETLRGELRARGAALHDAWSMPAGADMRIAL